MSRRCRSVSARLPPTKAAAITQMHAGITPSVTRAALCALFLPGPPIQLQAQSCWRPSAGQPKAQSQAHCHPAPQCQCCPRPTDAWQKPVFRAGGSNAPSSQAASSAAGAPTSSPTGLPPPAHQRQEQRGPQGAPKPAPVLRRPAPSSGKPLSAPEARLVPRLSNPSEPQRPCLFQPPSRSQSPPLRQCRPSAPLSAYPF